MQTLRRSLVLPQADFWLLGGLSLVVLSAVWLVVDWGHLVPVQQGLPDWVYWAGFAVNHPHFAYSYQLFYKGIIARWRSSGAGGRLRIAMAGVVAPLVLAVYFAAAFLTHNVDMLCKAGALMLFLVGWHYAKQGYGVLITTSVYRNIFYPTFEKRILYANAYIVWIYSWIIIHTEAARAVQFDLVYSIMVVPHVIVVLSTLAVIASSLLAAGVFIKAAIHDKKGICWNGLTGYVCAIYIWLLLPQVINSDALFLVVPFFHGLQYLPFVYKYKKSEYGDAAESGMWRNPMVLLVVFALAGMALGGLFMDIGPKFADRAYAAPHGFTKSFFLIAFTVFINIHHYLIDHSFWRRDNEGAQKFLFRA